MSNKANDAYNVSENIVEKQGLAPTYKHLNYNIYLFPWFNEIPTDTRVRPLRINPTISF